MSPNTSIQQVLDEVCLKQGFLPSSDYELRHGRTVLDVSITMRYSNLSNHAKLELVKASKTRAESKPLVALQLPSGERIQDTFDPNMNLWEMLIHFQGKTDSGVSLTKTEKGLHPVCVYMREEVIGEVALQNTTLKKFGITSGKAMMRLVHRQVDDNVICEIEEKIEKERIRQAKLVAKAAEKQSSNESFKTVPSESSVDPEPPGKKGTRSGSSSSEGARPKKTCDNSGVATSARSSLPTEEPMATSPTPEPSNQPESSLTSQQEQIAQSLARSILPGFNPEQHASAIAVARQRSQEQQPIVMQIPQPLFTNFKFPEESKGQNVYQNELSDVNKREFKPCDREPVLFSLDEAKMERAESTGPDLDLPDDFFEVTQSDIQYMMQDLKRKIDEEDGQMLMTSAMRQARLEAKMSKYKRVLIRFNFPDRRVLQAVFNPRETINSVHKYIKSVLEEKSLSYYLYITPPRKVLDDMAMTLIEANLAPMAVVYVGCQEKKDSYLSSAVLSEMSSVLEADKIVVKYMGSEIGEGTSRIEKKQKAVCSGPQPGTSAQASTGGDKVPKWFKTGKK